MYRVPGKGNDMTCSSRRTRSFQTTHTFPCRSVTTVGYPNHPNEPKPNAPYRDFNESRINLHLLETPSTFPSSSRCNQHALICASCSSCSCRSTTRMSRGALTAAGSGIALKSQPSCRCRPVSKSSDVSKVAPSIVTLAEGDAVRKNSPVRKSVKLVLTPSVFDLIRKETRIWKQIVERCHSSDIEDVEVRTPPSISCGCNNAGTNEEERLPRRLSSHLNLAPAQIKSSSGHLLETELNCDVDRRSRNSCLTCGHRQLWERTEKCGCFNEDAAAGHYGPSSMSCHRF